MSLATPGRIRILQRRLYLKAKAEPAFRFYLFYDKICRADILRHTYVLARANEGAPGSGRTDLRDDRGRGAGDVVGRAPGRPDREDIQTRAGAAGDDPQARWWRAAVCDGRSAMTRALVRSTVCACHRPPAAQQRGELNSALDG